MFFSLRISVSFWYFSNKSFNIWFSWFSLFRFSIVFFIVLISESLGIVDLPLPVIAFILLCIAPLFVNLRFWLFWFRFFKFFTRACSSSSCSFFLMFSMNWVMCLIIVVLPFCFVGKWDANVGSEVGVGLNGCLRLLLVIAVLSFSKLSRFCIDPSNCCCDFPCARRTFLFAASSISVRSFSDVKYCVTNIAADVNGTPSAGTSLHTSEDLHFTAKHLFLSINAISHPVKWQHFSPQWIAFFTIPWSKK